MGKSGFIGEGVRDGVQGRDTPIDICYREREVNYLTYEVLLIIPSECSV